MRYAIYIVVTLGVLAAAAVFGIPAWLVVEPLPEATITRAPAPADPAATALIRRVVDHLAGRIGERHAGKPDQLSAARQYLRDEMTELGLTVRVQEFALGGSSGKQVVGNLEAEIKGATSPDELIVVIANYDSMVGSPGGDTNASGAAAVVAIAAQAARWGNPPSRTVRFVLTTNKEPPYYGTAEMGSFVYVSQLKDESFKKIRAINVQSVGVYSDRPKSQRYPAPFDRFFPDVGNFVMVIGNSQSSMLARAVAATINDEPPAPRALGLALPPQIPGADWSDHRSFWNAGYEAVMISDTALYRNDGFGKADDTAQVVDAEKVAALVGGLGRAVRGLAQ